MSVNDVSALQAQQAVQQSSDQELKNLQAKVGALKRASPDRRAAEEKKLKEACEGFESIFIRQLWKEMRNTVPKEDILRSREEDQWRDMLDDETSKKMAADGGIGLKDVLFSQLKDRLTRASQAMPGAATEAQAVRPLRNPEGIALKKTEINPLPGKSEAAAPAPGPEAAPAGRAAEPTQAASAQEAGPGTGDVLSRVNALASRIELEWSKGGAVQTAEAAGPVPAASGTSAPAGFQAEARAMGETGAQVAAQAKLQGGSRTGFPAGVQMGVKAGAPAAPSSVQVAAAMSRPAQAGQAGQTAPQAAKPAAPAEAPVPELKPAAKDLETLSRLGQELLRGNLLGATSLGRETDEG